MMWIQLLREIIKSFIIQKLIGNLEFFIKFSGSHLLILWQKLRWNNKFLFVEKKSSAWANWKICDDSIPKSKTLVSAYFGTQHIKLKGISMTSVFTNINNKYLYSKRLIKMILAKLEKIFKSYVT